MTYLDPDHTRPANAGYIALRVAAVIAVLAFGWFALTVGSENFTGRPEIVQEPAIAAP
ncbi:hypothetical protein [Pelagibacterium halotolerans]|uniref:Uncharacterized protein n=1 Tax=Pelagibacterium halotolerans (strain DSM 22347 / JCM 15775 / CGMCC 1.7692 / B2) TaxID=1082931 RepID=G4RGR9_PELHB|nr:hypothetical protein [Pelagibacterium halotolerans]AEQ52108.1 hypothetical protein KKY_2099 [Pelagibacterium halotolerans B2]QJR18122.1 hypothetical protein HKM20_06525 [Pelagibacterium halotolerans]SDZ83676.1 hypothetical protein SAMN05428936_101171 [Pelagibacterium halotolerans]